MRTPRKLYLVVSRTFKGDAEQMDLFFSRKQAQSEAAQRNHDGGGKAPNGEPIPTDWRVETFVKGD